jgi:uncharacterized protein
MGRVVCNRWSLFLAALVVGWVVVASGVCAEDVDIQPQASPNRQQQSNGSSNNTSTSANGANGDQESKSVETQMQTIKQELRGQKSDPSQTAPIRDSEHWFQLKVPNYVTIRNRNIVMQQRDFSCGAACLATICRYYWGDDVTELMVLEALDQLLTPKEADDRIKNGLAMSDLRRAAVKLGYQSVVGTTTFAKLGEMKVPAIVGIQPEGHKHFVVLKGIFGEYVYLADPIRGNIRMPVWEFVQQWQKNAILVVAKPGEKVKKFSPLSLTEADICRGELNKQIIRSQESRQPPSPALLSH